VAAAYRAAGNRDAILAIALPAKNRLHSLTNWLLEDYPFVRSPAE